MRSFRTSFLLAVASAIFGWAPLGGLQTEVEEAVAPGQSYSSEARRHASDLLLGEAVTVRLRGLDAPARCEAVGRVVLEGEDVGKELLQAGLAWYCDRSALPNSALPEAEAEAGARASERGLWSDPEPVAPWVFRGAETCLEESGA